MNRNLSLSFCLFIAWAFAIPSVLADTPVETKYQWKESRSAGYTYKYVENDPLAARFYTLQNGLSVILSPSKKEPRIQAYITTKGGGKDDPAAHTGLAHYLEHMLFKGTKHFGTADWEKEKPLLDQIYSLYETYNQTTDETKRKEIYAEIDRVSAEAAKYAIANEYDKIMAAIGGAGTNAFTAYDQTAYTEDIPSNALDQFLMVQADRFQHPVFRIFHTELETVYEEKNRSLDNDNSKVIEALFAAIFPHHNYGKQTILGSVEHLKNPSLKAIQEFYDTYYVPNHMAVIMSGDFDPDEAIAKIDRAFAFMKPKAVPQQQWDEERPIEQPIIKEVMGPNPAFTLFAHRMPGAGTTESKMVGLVSSMLNNGSAGLVDLNLLKTQKLLAAYVFPYALNDYTLLAMQAVPLEGQSLEEARQLMLDELAKLRRGEFSDELISSVVNNMKKQVLQRREQYSARAQDLMSVFVSDLDWAEELAYIDWLSKITKEDVVKFAKQYLGDSNYVAVNKLQGVDQSIVKVDKPQITPVEVNRTAQSEFMNKVLAIPVDEIEPVWADYDRLVQRGEFDGQQVYLTRNEDNDLFTFTYKFDTGKWSNKLIGFALEYVEFLGTKNRSSEELSTELYQLATSLNIYAGDEETRISISGLDGNFVQSLQLLQELLRDCVADEQAFVAYKNRVFRARANAKEAKNSISRGLFAYAKYGPKNPFNNTLTDEELTALKASDLVSVIHELARTEHSILFHGPRDLAGLLKDLTSLKKAGVDYVTPVAHTHFSELPTEANQVYFTHYPMTQVDINWFRNSVEFDANSVPVVSLFNMYFGGGMGSLVFQTIRESKALAYSTYADYAQPSKAGRHYHVVAYIGTQADKFDDAIGGMNDLLNTLPHSAVGLESARTNLRKSLASHRIVGSSILPNYMAMQRLGYDGDISALIYEQIDDISFEDLQKFHQEQFSKKPFIYYIMGDESALNSADLEKLGPVKRLSLEEIFGY